uniref:Uncharacterized protein n=1 Tax=Mycena chlorophos TaxID=658473 RepID=A0ABQ0L4P8_MYCCL|nr:predicted protein [Mycena chlorophos]
MRRPRPLSIPDIVTFHVAALWKHINICAEPCIPPLGRPRRLQATPTLVDVPALPFRARARTCSSTYRVTFNPQNITAIIYSILYLLDHEI